jgi:general secretion pathway protein E
MPWTARPQPTRGLARLRRRSSPASPAELPTAEDLLDSADDAPAIRLINGIIARPPARRLRHPYRTVRDGLVIRMRIDGVLRETLRMPPHVAPVVVSRIKVMARLDIAERRCRRTGGSA